MSTIPEAASENKRRRGRPRAWYSTMGLDENGQQVETCTATACRTRRGEQNQQLAFVMWMRLGRNWRPEWAWFWSRNAGELDQPFCGGDDERAWSRIAFPTVGQNAAAIGVSSARVGILAELGRMSAEDALSWAAELATLPLETRSKDVERCLRNARLGRPQSTATGRLAQEIATLLDRHVTRGVSLDEAEDALRDVVHRVQVVRAGETRLRVEAEEPRLRVEGATPQTRVEVSEEEELPLVDGAGVLLRATVQP